VVTPDPTAVAPPSVALGSRMAEILVRLISGGTAERLTIMPTVLVERESV
jgi:DNA-binding LacI/PurR family transcriptional regulator